jgi:hypothetical protein
VFQDFKTTTNTPQSLSDFAHKNPVEVEKKEWKKKKTREREERESSETHLLLPILKWASQSEDEQA